MQRRSNLRDVRPLRDAEQNADLLVSGEPALGETQQLVTRRIEAETVNATVRSVQTPIEPAHAHDEAEEPDGLKRGQAPLGRRPGRE